MKFYTALALGTVAALYAGTATAETAWDFSTPWPDTNFQSKAAHQFAEAVGAATDGAVTITVHNGGEIGVSGSQSMEAVETGIVQMADFLLFLQAGDEPLLAIDTLPYLIQGQDEMAMFLNIAGPAFDAIAEKHNQKILYYVPWPSPGLYSKTEITSAEDLAGQRILGQPACFRIHLARQKLLIGAQPRDMARL